MTARSWPPTPPFPRRDKEAGGEGVSSISKVKLRRSGAQRHGSKVRKSEPGTIRRKRVPRPSMVFKTWDESEISRTSRASCDETHLSLSLTCLLTAVPQQCFATAAGQRYLSFVTDLSVALYQLSPQRSFV